MNRTEAKEAALTIRRALQSVTEDTPRPHWATAEKLEQAKAVMLDAFNCGKRAEERFQKMVNDRDYHEAAYREQKARAEKAEARIRQLEEVLKEVAS